MSNTAFANEKSSTKLTDEFKKNLTGNSYILVMYKLSGTSFNQLKKSQIEEIFVNNPQNHETVFVNLGKMLLLDIFIKNRDRLDWNSCNIGNIFLEEHSNNPIQLLDHDFTISSVFKKNIKSELSLLFKGKDAVNKTTVVLDRAFQDHFRKMGSDMKPFTDQGRIYICDTMIKGVGLAARELISKFPNNKDNALLTEILALSPNLGSFNVGTDVFELIEEIKRLL